jgi:hypothetical protein
MWTLDRKGKKTVYEIEKEYGLEADECDERERKKG